MEKLTNGTISIGVKEHGAELASLVRDGRQYLWQADKAFWQRHSPVLFPFVGSVWHGEYRTKGTAYPMGQHGFARDMDFTLVDKGADFVRFRLVSSEETRRRYPYDFILEISYTLEDSSVRVGWHVQNPSGETMPFQIGAHPAFYWPMLTDAEIEAGVEAMACPLAVTDLRGYFRIESARRVLPLLKISEGGCFGTRAELVLGEDGYLPLTVEDFSRDAIVIDGGDVTKVTLCGNDKKPYVSLSFSTPLVGLWSPPGKRAPFVCIEPWYGCADFADFTGDLSEKYHIQLLEPHRCFDAFYDITVE